MTGLSHSMAVPRNCSSWNEPPSTGITNRGVRSQEYYVLREFVYISVAYSVL